MTTLYLKRDTCRLCGSNNLNLAVPLEPMPIATPNFAVPGADRDAPVFTQGVPLELHLCGDCACLQVLHVGNPEIQYRHYVYTTSISLGLPEHFVKYAAETVGRLNPPAGGRVVEIGSNDGTLLNAFKQHGLTVLGIDPATAIAAQATENGIPTLAEFFNSETAARVAAEHGRADLIIANNMIANVDDMDGYTRGIAALLDPGGAFVFETQYGADVSEHTLLDTVYHEHLSYFNVRPLVLHFQRHGLEVIDVERIWTKGGSIRVTVQHRGGPRARQASVERLVAEEDAAGYHTLAYYRKMREAIATIRSDLRALVDAEKAAGRVVAGYGMSVGTTTLLAQFGLQQDIAFLVDDAPGKDPELLGPSYAIPRKPKEALLDEGVRLVIVFAWRYADPIMRNNAAYREVGGRFAIPLPTVTVQ